MVSFVYFSIVAGSAVCVCVCVCVCLSVLFRGLTGKTSSHTLCTQQARMQGHVTTENMGHFMCIKLISAITSRLMELVHV